MSEQNTPEAEEFSFTTDFVEWPRTIEGSYDEETQTESAECALVQVGLGMQPCILIKPNNDPENPVLTVNVSELGLPAAAFMLSTLAEGLKDALRERGEWDDEIDNNIEVTIHEV